MKKIKIKVHSDKIFAYLAMLSMVANLLSPFAALIPSAAYAEDVPAEETSQQVEETSSEPEETPAEEPAEEPSEEQSTEEISTEETQEPSQEEATEPEAVVETPNEIPADTFTVDPEVVTEEILAELPIEEPVTVTEDQPGEILPDGASDYRPEADISENEVIEVQEVVDPVVEEPKEEVKEYETLADGAEIKDSVEEDWNVDGEKAETKELVKLGIKYVFPLDEDVSITFTKLPKNDSDRSNLKIERVKVSDLNLPDDFNTDAEYAFDITTPDMEDGEFEYDLTLPKPEGTEVQVSYIEKSIEEAKGDVNTDDVKKVEGVKQDGGVVKVENINHFTIYVTTYLDASLSILGSTFAQGSTVYAKAGDLNSSKYYIIQVEPPSGNKFDMTTCKAGSLGNFSGTYVLPSDATIGTGWKVNLIQYDSSNCNGQKTTVASNSFEVTSGIILAGAVVNFPDDCSFNCTANDVTVQKMELVGDTSGNPLSCNPGETVTAYIKVTYDNHSTDRYAIFLIGDIYEDGVFKQAISAPTSCVDHMATGQDSKVISTGFTWDCGESIAIKDLTLSWDTNSNTCSNFFSQLKCNPPAQSYCGGGVDYIVVTPLVADFSGTNVCLGNTTQFTNSTSGGVTPYTYSWLFGDGVGTSSSQNPTYTYLTAGLKNVTLTATDSKLPTPQVDSQVNSVNVWANPVASFTMSVSSGYAPLTVDFTDTSTLGNASIVTWSWDFGDGSTSSLQNPSHQYINPGNYDVTLTITDEKGCYSNSSTASVVVNENIAHLTLVKTVTNNNGGTKVISDFPLFIDGVAALSGTKYEVSANVEHTASETGSSDYTASVWGGNCSSDGKITLLPGDDKTCTITNDDKAGTLIVKKIVVNDNGGDLGADDFTFSVNGAAAIAFEEDGQNDLNVNAGTYSVTEPAVTGYSTSYDNCDSLSIALGGTQTCTITNDDIAPTLTLVKTVTTDNGGNESQSAFSVFIDSVPAVWDSNTTSAGNHTVSENTLTGYIAGIWGGDCSALGIVTLGPGDNKTCTITNNDEAPTVTLIKSVITDDGGTATENDFGLSIDDNPATSGVAYPVDANTEIALDELGYAGYVFVSITGEGCPSSLGGTVTLDEGEDITCTITNDDVAPKLTIVKDPTNDSGGNALPDDFLLTVDDDSVLSGAEHTYLANIPLAIDETQLTGYTFTSITGDEKCPSVLGGTITLDVGDDITCTITNDDTQPKLTVTKIVYNSNFGTKQVSDFPLFVDATSVTSGEQNGFDVGTYTVSETGQTGYSAVISGDCDPNTGSVTLAVGDTKDCTITNTSQHGKIIIEKQTLPDGNSTLFDFSGDVAGSTSDGGTIEKIVVPGSYSVVETVLAGWDLTSIVCSDQDSGASVTAGNTASINVGNNETVTCTFTNTKLGSIQGKKFEDVNNNGTRQASTPTEPFLDDWTIKLYEEGDDWEYLEEKITGHTGTLGQFKFDNLEPGKYLVCEVLKTGWMQTAPVSGTTYDDTICHEINLTAGQAETGYLFGNLKLGAVQGMKFNDEDGDGNSHEVGEDYLDEWTVRIYKGWVPLTSVVTPNTLTQGQFKFEGLEPGTYQVCEVNKTDWDQTWPEIGDVPVADNGTSHSEYGLAVANASNATDEAPVCWQTVISSSDQLNQVLRFGNAQLTDIHGYKWNDLDGNGIEDGDELRLSGWEIFIDENDNQIWDSGELKTTTSSDVDPAHFGWYWFENLLPGNYEVCEVLQPGWLQTSSPICHSIDLPEGQNTCLANQTNSVDNATGTCNFGNQQVNPQLRISKENDANSVKGIGDIVTFTIKVKVLDSDLDNVTVLDLLPKGFSFVNNTGDWSVESDIQGVLPVSDPNYASPGTWDLGDLQEDEEVTITYKAEIGSDVDPGTYRDLAWTSGEDALGGNVLGLALDLGKVNEYFVGTEVEVEEDTPVKDSVDVEETEEEEEVLGASDIRLPATGASTTIINIVLFMGFVGGLFMTIGGIGKMIKVKNKKDKNTRMKKALLTMLALGFSLILTSRVYAESDPKLVARVEAPESPAISTFKLNFVVLDANETPRTIEAECWKQGPSDGDFVKFADADVDGTGGNSNNCEVGDSVLNQSGTFAFKVKVRADGGSWQDSINTESIEYDNEGPDKPEYIEKDKKSDCKYELTVKTAEDGQTSSIKIYRDDSKEMDLHSGNLIKTKTIGPDERYEFDYEVYGGDCGKTWYFAVIAFDDSGIASDPRAEELVTSVTVTTTETEETFGALEVLGGANLPGEGETTGGEESTETGGSEGTVLGEKIEEDNFALKMIKSPWFWLILVVLAYITSRVIKNKNKKK